MFSHWAWVLSDTCSRDAIKDVLNYRLAVNLMAMRARSFFLVSRDLPLSWQRHTHVGWGWEYDKRKVSRNSECVFRSFLSKMGSWRTDRRKIRKTQRDYQNLVLSFQSAFSREIRWRRTSCSQVEVWMNKRHSFDWTKSRNEVTRAHFAVVNSLGRRLEQLERVTHTRLSKRIFSTAGSVRWCLILRSIATRRRKKFTIKSRK